MFTEVEVRCHPNGRTRDRARWYFLRHAESLDNAAQIYSGQLDPPLSADGRRHAIAAAGEVARLHVARILTSDLQRAVDTASILASPLNLTPTLAPGLRERHFGTLQGCQKTAERRTRLSNVVGYAPPGGEALAEVVTRAVHTLAGLEGAQTTLIVTHGTLMTALCGRLGASSCTFPNLCGMALTLPLAFWTDWQLTGRPPIASPANEMCDLGRQHG